MRSVRAAPIQQGRFRLYGIHGRTDRKNEKGGIHTHERNLNNKFSRSGFLAAFLLQCMFMIDAKEIKLL